MNIYCLDSSTYFAFTLSWFYSYQGGEEAVQQLLREENARQKSARARWTPERIQRERENSRIRMARHRY